MTPLLPAVGAEKSLRTWLAPPCAARASLVTAKQGAQFLFGHFEGVLSFSGEVSPRSVHVKGQHRHRGPERARFPPVASLRRSLERPGDTFGAFLFEHLWFEIERVR